MGVHQAMFIFVSSTICSRLCWTTMSRLFIKNKKLKILQSIIKLMNFSLNMIWIFSSLTNLFIVSRISLRNLTDDGESHAHHRLSFRLSRYLLARNATRKFLFLKIAAGKHHGIGQMVSDFKLFMWFALDVKLVFEIFYAVEDAMEEKALSIYLFGSRGY